MEVMQMGVLAGEHLVGLVTEELDGQEVAAVAAQLPLLDNRRRRSVHKVAEESGHEDSVAFLA